MKRYTGATDMDTLTEISEAHGVNPNISPEMAKKMLLSHIKLQDSKIEKLQADLALAREGLEWTTWFCLESLKGKSKDTRESEIDFIGNQSREILAQLDKKGE